GGVELRAERTQREEMRVVAPPPDDSAARRPEPRMFQPRDERRREQKRCAYLTAEVRRDLLALQPRGRDADRLRIELVDLRTECAGDLEHSTHVADARDVVEGDRLVGEERRGDERQRLILVPRRTDLSAQRCTAFDDEACHSAGSLSVEAGR